LQQLKQAMTLCCCCSLSLQAIHQLEQAMTLAHTPSPSLGQLVRSLAAAAAQELAAGAKLREMIASGARIPAGAGGLRILNFTAKKLF
jgi:hypothetical protein